MKTTKVTLKFPSQFSQYINHIKSVEFEGEKVSEFINHLDETYGSIRERIFDNDQNIRPYINLFVGKKNIEAINGMDTIIMDGECISLLLSRAGG